MSAVRLKHVCEVIDVRAGSSRPPLLAVSIHRGVVPRDELTDDEPRADDLSTYRLCEPGDIVLNRMRAFQGAIGMAPASGLVSPDYLVLRPLPQALGRFLHYLFRSSEFVGQMVSRLRGIGSTDTGTVRTPRINPEDLLGITVQLPPIPEQQAIADYLDRETARIDALIAAKRRMRSLLLEHESALVSALAVPPECRFVHLRYLATLQTGVTVDSGRDTGADAVTRPYLRVANVQSGRLNLDEVTTITVPAAVAARATLRDGDVVMTEGGDIDKLGRGTVWRNQISGCLHQNHIFAVRPDPRRLDSDYLAVLSMSAHARGYFESTGVQSTNLASTSASKIMSLGVPALTLTEQRAVVDTWSERSAITRSLQGILDRQVRLLNEHRQALITAAVRSDIPVPVAA